MEVPSWDSDSTWEVGRHGPIKFLQECSLHRADQPVGAWGMGDLGTRGESTEPEVRYDITNPRGLCGHQGEIRMRGKKFTFRWWPPFPSYTQAMATKLSCLLLPGPSKEAGPVPLPQMKKRGHPQEEIAQGHSARPNFQVWLPWQTCRSHIPCQGHDEGVWPFPQGLLCVLLFRLKAWHVSSGACTKLEGPGAELTLQFHPGKALLWSEPLKQDHLDQGSPSPCF